MTIPAVRTLMLAATLACGMSAQVSCYEPSFGTLLGIGDDTMFAIQPLGITFPFNGTTYTDVYVSTNGYLYLSNAGTPAAGSGANYSFSASTFTGATAPIVSPFGHDLNITSANGAGVYLSTLTAPNRTVITWDRLVEYGRSVLMTVQCQLYDNGQIVFFYSSNTAVAGNTTGVGFSPGSGAVDPGASNLSANPSTAASTTYELFSTSLAFDIQGRATIFTPNALGGYDVDTNTCVGSMNTSFGAGCVFGASSYYQQFAANGFDLGVAAPAVNSVLMTPAGPGYLVTPGSANWFTPTTASLGLTDDSQSTLTLPTAFTYPGGSTTSLAVCSNGFIWLQPDASNDYSASTADLLGLTARLAPAWADLLPNATNNVYAEFDVASNSAYFTWDAVPTLTSGGALRMQVAVDLTNMTVEYRYQDCSVPSSVCVVGWSQGGGAVNPGSTDLSLSMPFVTTADSAPLTLAAAGSPTLGGTVTWTTGSISASALVSVQFLSFGAINPGFDLGPIGAPTCFQLVNPAMGAMVMLSGAPSATLALTIPTSTSWIGAHLYSQSASLLPGINALGAVTSNGIDSAIRAF